MKNKKIIIIIIVLVIIVFSLKNGILSVISSEDKSEIVNQINTANENQNTDENAMESTNIVEEEIIIGHENYLL